MIRRSDVYTFPDHIMQTAYSPKLEIVAHRLGLFARVMDAALVMAGAIIAYVLRFEGLFAWDSNIVTLVAFNTVASMLLFPALGVYESWRGRSLWELTVRLSAAWFTAFALGLVFIFAIEHPFAPSRLWYGAWFAVSLGLMLAAKCASHLLLRSVRKHWLNLKSVAIVGANEYSRQLIERLRDTRGGFRPACIVDEAAAPHFHAGGLPVFRTFAHLVKAVRERTIDEIWLVLPLKDEARIHAVLREFRHDFVNIRFIPNVQNIGLFNHSISDVLGVPAINLLASPPRDVRFMPKAVFDRIFAAGVLLCLAPLLIVVALLVKRSSPGPVFFRQWRKGINGAEFQIYKFRTMVVHAEAPGQLTQAKQRDSRVTRLGAFLRRTSLDELPQFINVLRGEMSVVGPRPHALQHDEQYKDLVTGYMWRYRIKPGITGWAQINGYRGETDRIEKMQSRIAFDLYYIENWTFWLDLKIVLMTLLHGFRSTHAY
jgi:putative colanic acid biosynthesis UDP-glucose lipid carrier transferase